MDNYFNKPGISNSFLGCVKSGTSFKCSEETLDFGSQVHEACLEPEVYKSKLHLPNYIKNIHKVSNMACAIRNNVLFKMFLTDWDTQYESEHFFEIDGLLCKLKADLKLRNIIGDIKTTDARTREEFEKRAVEYGYNRQGAFYLDGTGSHKFMIFAVCKKYPHPTFTYVLDYDDPEIREGREEYKALIEKYKTLTPEQIQKLKS